MPDTQTTTYDVPEFDTTLPDAPTYNQPNKFTPNPYAQDSAEGQFYNAYQTYLGRDPEAGIIDWRKSQLGQRSAADQIGDISNSYEALGIGRARNEIDPVINSQERSIYDQIGIARQQAQSQLEALKPAYEAQFAALGFSRQEQEQALDSLRNQVLQDTDYNATQLQGKFLPAQQNAFAAANRRGLLDSTVSLGLLNQGFQPIQQGLTDLYRSSQRQLSDAEQKRQGILQKYGFDYQNLVGKREQEAKALKDQYAILQAQKQNEATQLEGTRAGSIQARAGELGDTNRQYQLQLQALLETQRSQQEASRLARDQFNAQQAQLNK